MLLSRRHFLLFLLLVAFAPPAAGQVDFDDTRAPLPGPVAVAVPDPLAVRLCDALHALPESREAACRGAAKPSRGLADECARVLSISLRETRVTAGHAAVERCERESAAVFADCAWVNGFAPPAPPSCRGLVAGLLAAGTRCDSSFECQAGLACRGASPAARVCAPPGAPGSACGGSGDLLATYLKDPAPATHAECDGYCFQGRCAAAVAAGGGCLSTVQCAAGHHCAAGRCTPGPAPVAAKPWSPR